MLRMLKQRFNDIRVIKKLCMNAERHANAEGQEAPGLEHFVLAALDLPDGTARKAFQRLGADPDIFRSAIAEQYNIALGNIGIDATQLAAMQGNADGISPSGKIFRSQPQVQAFMQQLASRQREGSEGSLLGAHVIEAIADFQHGVASRAFAAMGIDRKALKEAARKESGRTRAGVDAA
ncbi:Clp protease N-terminal domain-containing protein [Noviherbaspirillum sp. CPCC 100848]|uniref:Clp protease N-terminal domain-containing protein n=1 Tax=Noviherbaspirillum album TaxID=3080276 RepID=A0ABU6JES7_9BURK|nr:Clp protease N-terminal domain-containing protein [Noviherbaspirillum sp. CPCC 100848]MEC4721956.1 Clp protease N-terminal domain-containing protein [Noviherbaspirillum sp. CPCC 100848]